MGSYAGSLGGCGGKKRKEREEKKDRGRKRKEWVLKGMERL